VAGSRLMPDNHGPAGAFGPIFASHLATIGRGFGNNGNHQRQPGCEVSGILPWSRGW